MDCNSGAHPHTTDALSLEYTVHVLFEKQARLHPRLTAVLHGERALTYAELEARADHLARYLSERGVRSDQLAAVCIERSPEMIIALCAVLKAGGAYLPLDPNYPPDRLRYMLEDARPAVVITQRDLSAKIPSSSAVLIDIDEVLKTSGCDAPVDDTCMTEVGGNHLAYVIYTSGSTGRPKGIAMPHRSMVNLLSWHWSALPTRPGQRVLQFAALSFDVAFQEIFSTLCSGGTLVLIDEWARRDPHALLAHLIKDNVERLFVPPLMLQSLAECAQRTTVPKGLREIITAGEPQRITAEIAALMKKLPGCTLHNHYGPTESHVVTAGTLSGDPDRWPTLPSIGRPISNTAIHLLDWSRQKVPPGAIGEIYIGGMCLARGYLNLPELTAERFIRDPHSDDPQARLYKTGDLARWTPEGTLEYLGRNDEQVKIRGFRIELGEIETQLARHQQVKEAVVIARQGPFGSGQLVAYVTLKNSQPLQVEELRAHLKATLPEHMVPSAFVVVTAWPTTANGKLDRRALPGPPSPAAFAGREYRAPEGPTEQLLAALWQDLLRLPRVGRDDNFFELGGQSLLMMHLMERLRQHGLAVDVRSLYLSQDLKELATAVSSPHDTPNSSSTAPRSNSSTALPEGTTAITPEMLPLVPLLAPEHIDQIIQTTPGGVANIQDIYPLAPLQEGFLFHSLVARDQGDAYVRPVLLSLSSRTAVEQLVAALQIVIARHDVLRTAILWEGLPCPVQVVLRQAPLSITEIHLTADQDPLAQLEEHLTPQRQRLDLRHAPLLSLEMAIRPDAPHYAVLRIHHLVCDHESFRVLLEELQACLQDRAHRLPDPIPHRDYIEQLSKQAHRIPPEDFFRRLLGDIDEPTTAFGLHDIQSDPRRMREAVERIDPQRARYIRATAQQSGVSVATLFHAAWALFVSLTSGRSDVVYGTVLLGRLQSTAGAQRAMGMFINTLPLRVRLNGMTARELIQQIHRHLAELLAYETTPLTLAQSCSGVPKGTPLFNTLLDFRHSAAPATRTWTSHAGQEELAPGVQIITSREWTNYPISMAVDDEGDGFTLTAQADRRIEVSRLTGYLLTALGSLLEALEHAPETPALSLPVVPEHERRLLLDSFNPATPLAPDARLAQEVFEEQVQRTPDATALVYEGESLSYAELNAHANQLARYLIAHGATPNGLVGLCLERSAQMIVALLGILKAGCAYLPLDPSYPPQRLRQMLTEASPAIVLTEHRVTTLLEPTTAQLLPIDAPVAAGLDRGNVKVPLGVDAQSAAYVIFTSGSTGAPKGVIVTHRNLVSSTTARMQYYPEPSRFLLLSPLGFDSSVAGIFGTLLQGGTLIVAPQEAIQDPAILLRTLQDQEPTCLLCVPALYRALLSVPGTVLADSTVSKVILAGEACPASLIAESAERAPGIRIFNEYGPTEATVWATVFECQLPLTDRVVPIGRPIDNTRIYILNPHLQPVPLEAVGELFIGGTGVARGYLHRPDLTQERFLPDPFSPGTDARMYKTGDLARWRIDGTLEYLGRTDSQVKLRGCRVELTEIEAQLTQHERIREAAAIVREDGSGEKRLVAYVVPRALAAAASAPSASEINTASLRAYLRERLPDFMVPHSIVVLDRLLLTPNGKLDRQALPGVQTAESDYEAPRGSLEEQIANIWRDTLRLPRIGREDNFFELGGHSLTAMQTIVRLRAALSLDLPISLLFKHPTVRELAAHVEEVRQQELLDLLEARAGDTEELMRKLSFLSDSQAAELARQITQGMHS